jgi:hypothetical protein
MARVAPAKQVVPLLAPYLVWLTYASALNYDIMKKNPDVGGSGLAGAGSSGLGVLRCGSVVARAAAWGAVMRAVPNCMLHVHVACMCTHHACARSMHVAAQRYGSHADQAAACCAPGTRHQQLLGLTCTLDCAALAGRSGCIDAASAEECLMLCASCPPYGS